jgi:predicted lipoprotein
LVSDTAALTGAAQALCTAPDAEALEAAQGAWRVVRVRWKEAEAFYFGPAHDQRARILFDWPTLKTARVEGLIGGDQPLTAEVLAVLPADAGGMGAAEYVLFGDGAGADPLAALVDDASGRRCAYLVGVVGAVSQRAQAIELAWLPQGEGFGDALRRAGAGSVTYKTAREAVSEVVNHIIFAVEDAANLTFGVALGLDGAAAFDPTRLPAHRSGHTLAEVEAALRGVRAVYVGQPDGSGVSGWVVPRAADVDARVRAALAAAEAAVGLMAGTTGAVKTLPEVLASDRAQVQAAFDALKTLQVVLEAEVSPLLGVSLTFNDNDGD